MRRQHMMFLCGLLCAAAPVGQVASGEEAPVSAQVAESGYTSAFVCGRCHTDIYNSWTRSMHSHSLSDPIFEVSFMQAIKADPSARALCLGCHAPATLINKDLELKEGITREGVTCDFCHTVTGVQIGNRHKPYLQQLGKVKRSTMILANSPAHDVAYSDLHSKSEFCGGCHHFESENGTLVMGTYMEWLAGPYASEGIQCQDCHMVLAEGRIVAEEVKKSSGPFNLHDLIHDSKQLREAVRTKIVSVKEDGDDLVVTAEVSNVGSGHMVPTGVPNRVVALRVDVTLANGHMLHQEKEYRKNLAGPNGSLITMDYEAFLLPVTIVSDNRLKPRETRTETIRFKDLPGRPARVAASAIYRYAPLVIDKKRMDITMAADTLQIGRFKR